MILSILPAGRKTGQEVIMAKNVRARRKWTRTPGETPDGPLVIYVNFQGHGGQYGLGRLTESSP
jgi:hypothetical protein